jgi:large subunit ribosomal protein L22
MAIKKTNQEEIKRPVGRPKKVTEPAKKEPAKKLHKLLLSAINNWEQKSGESAENVELYVKTIFVNEGKMLKRFQPAPQGRAYRIRKRSNHVSITLENKTA